MLFCRATFLPYSKYILFLLARIRTIHTCRGPPSADSEVLSVGRPPECRVSSNLNYSPLPYSCATCSLLVLPDVFDAREISVTPTDVCTAAVSALWRGMLSLVSSHPVSEMYRSYYDCNS